MGAPRKPKKFCTPRKIRERSEESTELPTWAVREIRSLSKSTGISFQKILKAALGFGIYKAKEELASVAALLESAEALATFKEDEGQATPETLPVIGETPADTVAPHTGSDSTEARPDNAEHERNGNAEADKGNDFVDSILRERVLADEPL